MKLWVLKEALVMPSSRGSATRRALPLGDKLLVNFLEDRLFHMLAQKELGVPGIGDPDPLEHLSHNDLDMLVIDLDALEPIDLLDFIDQVLGNFFFAKDRQNIMGIGRAVHKGLARAHIIAFVHADVFALRDQILTRVSHLGRDYNFALALGVFSEAHHAVDFGNNGVFLGLSHLEEFGNPGQTAGDVLCFRGLARNSCKNVSGEDLITLDHHQNGADRHEVARRAAFTNLGRFAFFVLDGDPGPHVGFPEFDNHFAGLAGNRVQLFLHGLPFGDIAELYTYLRLRSESG